MFAPKPAQDKQEAEHKPSDTTEPKKTEDVAKPATPGTPLFSKADTPATTTAQAPSSTATLFGNKPAFGTPQQQPSTNLFAPKPASTTAQDASQTSQANPFSGLFALKPAAPAISTPEKFQPFQAPSPSIFAPKTPAAGTGGASQTTQETSGSKFSFQSGSGAAATTSEAAKQTTSTTTASSQAPSLFAPRPSEPSTTLSKTAPVTNGQDALKVDGKTPETGMSVDTETNKALVPKAPFGTRGPRGLPANLSKELRDDVELLYRVRMLNECFKRKISELDPAKDDFDVVVLFYMRVRETIGAPTGAFRTTTSKRKVREDEDEHVDGGSPLQKKSKPAELTPAATPNDRTYVGKTDKAATPANPFSTSTFKPFESQPTTPSHKRKAVDDEGSTTEPAAQSEKRARNTEASESATASIFASSFSSSKASDSTAGASKKESTPFQAGSLFKPSGADSSKSTASPAPSTPTLFKPTLTAAESKESTSVSSSTSSTSLFKPTAQESGPSTSGTPAKSPFTFKPTGDKSTESPAKPAFEIPKFGTGATTNFFSQFKAQAEKDAEKEKAKRKAEEFDSDEDDEAEWERKDAEERQKKRENFEKLAKKRSKFIPGKGFVFEDDEEAPTESQTVEEKPSVSAAPSASTTSSSIFSNAGSKSPPKSNNNPFSHLSATTSEAEEEEESSEAGSTDGGDEKDDMSKDASHTPSRSEEESGVEESSGEAAGAKSEVSGEESSDDGDIAKALKRKSEEAAAEKAASDVQSTEKSNATTPPAPAPASGRSLFDRIQHDQDGKPKRQLPEEEAKSSEEKKDSQNPFTTLFGNSKFASSFNTSGTTSPSIFAPNSRPTSSQGNASTSNAGTTSIFSSSVNSTGSLFGSPTLATSGSTSGSLFAPSKTSITNDNTWNPNSPIKFGTTTVAATTSSTSTAMPATSGAGSSKPFSTLFGGQTGSATQNTTTASSQTSGPQQTGFGFTFGGPAQPAASQLAPSTGASADASRVTTPAGVTPDTGADESGDGDAAPPEPQINLARSGAGEEEEDVLLETRARGLKLAPGSGWESQGVGYLRILKHRSTSRSRVLLRADPSGKVILNAALMRQIKYSVAGTSVQFLVPKAEGAPEQWALRVKKEEVERLASTMEEAKV